MNNYQNIVLNGKEYGVRERKDSIFFNENKWHTFIEPFLPEDCTDLTFIDFGCNYGIFLKLAKQMGFKRVVGIENNLPVVEIARQYTDADIIRGEINESLYGNGFLNDLCASDYILLSNFHYHVHISALVHFLNIMRRKTRYAIVVSAEDARSKLYNAKPDMQSVCRYFKDWSKERVITAPTIKDPVPRKMFSLLFKTGVERIPIKTIRHGRYGKRFYAKVMRGQVGKHTPMTHPVLLRQDNSLIDGYHRLATLELAGEKSVLVEWV